MTFQIIFFERIKKCNKNRVKETNKDVIKIEIELTSASCLPKNNVIKTETILLHLRLYLINCLDTLLKRLSYDSYHVMITVLRHSYPFNIIYCC